MDKKALKILFDKHWSSAGWIRDKEISKTDFEYAKSKGLMFDDIYIDHKQTVDWLLKSFEKTSRKHIVKCFLSSLSTRQLHLRSGLSSYAFARHFPKHDFFTTVSFDCDICGSYKKDVHSEDLNILNFERIKWGGVRLTDPVYVGFDFDLLLMEKTPDPNEEDIDIFNKIIAVIESCESTDRANQLEKKLAPVLKSNKEERKGIIDALGICGILETENHKGFFDHYIPKRKRADRPISKTDWSYPVDWWTGKDGINKAALNFYFEDYLK